MTYNVFGGTLNPTTTTSAGDLFAKIVCLLLPLLFNPLWGPTPKLS